LPVITIVVNRKIWFFLLTVNIIVDRSPYILLPKKVLLSTGN